MIDQHLLDRESFARESTVETMKSNTYLKSGDTVLVALGEGGYSFYNIVSDPNVIKLNNGLFAVIEKDRKRYTKEEIDIIVSELNEKIGSEEQNSAIHAQLAQSIQNLSEKLLEKADKIHTHTKSDITDFPTSMPNPFTLTITNGVNKVVYDGTENREINISVDGGIPEAHKHNGEDIIEDKNHQLVTSEEKDKWNNKSDINHVHDDRYHTIEEATRLLQGKSDISHNHPAVDIIVDDERTFISKQERNKWNAKSDGDHKHKSLVLRSGVHTVVYDGTQEQELFIDSSGLSPISHRHNASDVEQDSGHRFVTDSEKNSWNQKSDEHHSHSPLTIISSGSSFVYDGTANKTITIESDRAPLVHIHKAKDIETEPDYNFVSNAEKYLWNSKADGNHTHVMGDFNEDPDHQFITNAEREKWNQKSDAHSHPYLSVNGGTINGSVTVNGNFTATRVYNAVWNDYAEFFERGEETEAGDIIALSCVSDKEEYIKASLENPVVVGVHSDSFAHLIGGKETSFEENLKEFIPVGLAGRVKCKIVGKVLKGQYIGLSNLPGIGTTVDYLNPYIVGIALEDKLNEGLGIIKILIK